MPPRTKYGSVGDFHGIASKHPLYFRWINMLRRCYEPNFHGYMAYGGRGVTVEPFLRVFANYASFVETLPNYENLVKEPSKWQIDKDQNGGYEYSRKTIRIVSSAENLELENSRKRIPVYQICPDGTTHWFDSIYSAANATGVHRGNIARAVRTGYKAGGSEWRCAVD